MTDLRITGHAIHSDGTVIIGYALDRAELYTGIAVSEADTREYAKSYEPKSEGQMRFVMAHGRKARVCLTAWCHRNSDLFRRSEYIDLRVPYPVDVDAVRAIVREEIATDKAEQAERRAAMMADVRAEKPVYAFVNYGTEPIDPGPDMVDDLVRIIHTELKRQSEQDSPSPYYGGQLPYDGPTLLDGMFDLQALAQAILSGGVR